MQDPTGSMPAIQDWRWWSGVDLPGAHVQRRIGQAECGANGTLSDSQMRRKQGLPGLAYSDLDMTGRHRQQD